MKHINKQNLLTLGLFFLLIIPSLLPIFQKGFFVTDDAEWMIIRLSAFYQTLVDGQIPVRFIGRLNHEYGYPVATFLYPAFMYMGSAFLLLKIGAVEAVKMILGITMAGSFIFTYYFLRRFFDKLSSLTGALFYLYAPYHLYDLYVRGSVGELLAIMIAPFIFWQIERKSVFWSGIGIGFLILSHNTLAFLFLVLTILYMLLDVYVAGSKNKIKYFLIILLGLGLSAFYWTPVIGEIGYAVFAKTKVSDWRGYFAPMHVVGYETFLIFISAALLFVTKKASVKKHRLTLLFLTIGFLATVLASKISMYFWHFIPSEFFQFPFRFLSITLFCGAFLCAFVVSSLKGIIRKFFIAGIVILLSITMFRYVTNVKYIDKGEGFYTTNSATTTVHDEYMPVWVSEKPQKRPDTKVEIIKGDGSIRDISYENKNIHFTANLKNDSVIQINTIYWPGWNAYMNTSEQRKEISISHKNAKGLMTLNIPQGSSRIHLVFSETRLRLISDIISLLSFAALVFISFKNRNIKTSTK